MNAPLRQLLETEAKACGFDAMGIARPDAAAQAGDRLKAWVADGFHGEMAWMADRLTWRADPRVLWPEVRSVIMLGQSYAPEHDPLDDLARRDRAAISVYAKHRDYHDVIKKRLKRLGRWLIDHGGGEIKVFVDTAPVMEKPIAQAAGLGWQGKHTNLVSRDLGSWFFLGAIFTTVEFSAEPAHQDHCGGCRRCLDVCPTAAFPAPYRLDARKCISYLTIEHKGPIPRGLRSAMGNRIYGCDDCLVVCPWNKFAQAGHELYAARPQTDAPPLAELADLDDDSFRERFRGSPIKRIGRDRFLRNVLIAIGNSGDASLLPKVRSRLSDCAPVVRGAAVWALTRFLDKRSIGALRPGSPDPDPDVEQEWQQALQPLSTS
ncbi:MAG: tRNA epoxyqueuosine(34) reductase QueG [Pseudomonadota bacterium]